MEWRRVAVLQGYDTTATDPTPRSSRKDFRLGRVRRSTSKQVNAIESGKSQLSSFTSGESWGKEKGGNEENLGTVHGTAIHLGSICGPLCRVLVRAEGRRRFQRPRSATEDRVSGTIVA